MTPVDDDAIKAEFVDGPFAGTTRYFDEPYEVAHVRDTVTGTQHAYARGVQVWRYIYLGIEDPS